MQSVFAYPPETLEYLPEDYFVPLDLAALFPDQPEAPLEIDLGSGDGTFLVESARRNPEHRFLGVERLKGRVRKTTRKAARLGLTNLRLMRIDSPYFVRHLLPPGSVRVLHFMFPDPWPKRKHAGNRLFQPAFLDAVAIALCPGGEMRISTDNLPYFEQMREVFSVHPVLTEEPGWNPGPDYPQTDFERYFRGQGLPIYRALLRRPPAGLPLPF